VRHSCSLLLLPWAVWALLLRAPRTHALRTPAPRAQRRAATSFRQTKKNENKTAGLSRLPTYRCSIHAYAHHCSVSLPGVFLLVLGTLLFILILETSRTKEEDGREVPAAAVFCCPPPLPPPPSLPARLLWLLTLILLAACLLLPCPAYRRRTAANQAERQRDNGRRTCGTACRFDAGRQTGAKLNGYHPSRAGRPQAYQHHLPTTAGRDMRIVRNTAVIIALRNARGVKT